MAQSRTPLKTRFWRSILVPRTSSFVTSTSTANRSKEFVDVRRRTLLADRLIEALDERIEGSECLRVGIGFPVSSLTAASCDRAISHDRRVTTDVDPDLEAQCRLRAPRRTLQGDGSRRAGRERRHVGRPRLDRRHGVELVLTLGTGLGIALAIDGALRKIRDVGAEVFVRGKTYDQSIGEHSSR